MGSEILDSSRTAGSRPVDVALSPEVDAAATSSVPVVELTTPEPVSSPDPRAPRGRATRAVKAYLVSLPHNPSRRRTALALVATALVLVIVTAAAVSARSDRRTQAAAASELAVDARISFVPQPSGVATKQVSADDATLELLLHNLGPQSVHLVGLSYTSAPNGGSAQRSGVLVQANVAVGPGEQLDQVFPFHMPCLPPGALPEGSPTVRAQLRTADGRQHDTVVDTRALEAGGGVFQACSVFQALLESNGIDAGPVLHSVLDGLSDVITIQAPGSVNTASTPLRVSLSASGLPAEVRYTTTPPLPAAVLPGESVSVRITPVVHGCPRTPIDYDQLSQIGLTYGDTYSDQYLPLLTAEAIGRACGGGRR
jgi:hypothetical protein